MKKALILVGILSAAVAAYAGEKQFVPLSIQLFSDSTGEAQGSLGDVRASSSSLEAIYCLSHTSTGLTRVVYCSAHSSRGEYFTCWTLDPFLVATADTLQGDSFLRFDWNKDGECTYILVINSSQFRPKTP